ncbi:MAG TPA: MATE family efflux transporter [Woeseiaceae bacterium]|nr:MATE family efflux transporter [Woeseiaceae bacterium]
MSDAGRPEHDITGRDRLVRNLFSRWLGQLVVILSGFIIPRLIDDSLGAAALGIWDLGWSTINYFRLMGFGFAGGLNRFVALYNAQGDRDKLRRAVSSTVFLQVVIAVCTAAAALVLAAFLPVLFARIPPADLPAAQVLIAFLGGNLAVRMLFWPSRGILTGHHYWTITSAVSACGDILVLAGLFTVLRMGGGLAELGMVVFGGAVVTESVRTLMAKRVYRDRLLIWGSVDRRMIWKMFVYGMKNNVTAISSVFSYQTTALLLAAAAGPAALAIYARPMAIYSQVERLITQYAFLLTPMAGSLQGLARGDELREFFLSSMKSSLAMTLPAMLLLGGYGDALIRLWMGADYVVPALAPLLGLGLLLPFAHAAALRILAGIDAHGRIALKSLAATAVALGVAVIPAFALGWSPVAAACVVGVATTAGPGITVIVGACRRLSVPAGEYLRTVVLVPVACNLPLAVLIACSRVVDPEMTILEVLPWGIVGAAVTGALYWRFLLGEQARAAWSRRVTGRRPVLKT